MHITDEIRYVGVNDHVIDLFEGLYYVPNGMAYNSYVIVDERIAVMDSVDSRFADEWLDNIHSVLDGKSPDYLVIQHMEPDHSGSITRFMEVYPGARIVSSWRAYVMMNNYFGTDYRERRMEVREGDTLFLGKHELIFIEAPMIHWPEVIMTYDNRDKILFSADAFGKFGALDVDEDWACEARRYYFGIVGKYGVPVQTLLKKASVLDIQVICPLHGPVLTENIGYYIDLYNTWSAYKPEENGVMIAYTSVYGHTKKAVEQLAEMLCENGCPKVVINDLARCDMAEAVEDAFRYSKLVLATTTYNGDVFPFMREFIHHLTERNFSNRTVGFIENGSWSPVAAKGMMRLLEKSRNLIYMEPVVRILSALNEESTGQLISLAQALCRKPRETEKPESIVSKRFVCKICGYVYEGETLPENYICPLCKHGMEDFEEVNNG